MYCEGRNSVVFYPRFTNPEDLEGTLQTDLTDPTVAFLDDHENNAFSMLAEPNERCSFETSQLTSTWSRRGGVLSQCDNPKGDSGVNVPTIRPKIAPFIDIQTMEPKTICPSQHKTPYSIAVCSSGRLEILSRIRPIYWITISFGLREVS